MKERNIAKGWGLWYNNCKTCFLFHPTQCVWTQSQVFRFNFTSKCSCLFVGKNKPQWRTNLLSKVETARRNLLYPWSLDSKHSHFWCSTPSVALNFQLFANLTKCSFHKFIVRLVNETHKIIALLQKFMLLFWGRKLI
jgi:hypothetical protein